MLLSARLKQLKFSSSCWWSWSNFDFKAVLWPAKRRGRKAPSVWEGRAGDGPLVRVEIVARHHQLLCLSACTT
jgi:hypothetical protein